MIIQNPIEKTATCACGVEFSYAPMIWDGQERFAPTLCDECTNNYDMHVELERQKARQCAQDAAWREICPELYQHTDPTQLTPKIKEIVDGWKLGSKAPAFIGRAGTRKTRAAFLILHRMHFDGVKVAAISSTRFAKYCADQFEDDPHKRAIARKGMECVRRARLILLDDLGKQKMSDRAELELYDLLEHRTSNMLPTMWTANSAGTELLQMFSVDRGEAIIRRLAEFSQITTLAR
jgi:hypothetical protein